MLLVNVVKIDYSERLRPSKLFNGSHVLTISITGLYKNKFLKLLVNAQMEHHRRRFKGHLQTEHLCDAGKHAIVKIISFHCKILNKKFIILRSPPKLCALVK